ncbi:hypothetical protein FAVG1_09261 [Fusarium avenaceum]|nr:hypothetical protein FAVG1_09261 [Fusarium avenaceum]
MATGVEILGAVLTLWRVSVVADDAITLWKRIYDGKPTRDNDLEDFANQMSGVIDDIQKHYQAMSKSKVSSKAETKLAEIANHYKSCVRELQTELCYVTSIQKKGNLGTAVKSGIRSWRRRKNIERIALKLSNYQDAMDTQMLSQLCSDFDDQTLQHQERFHDIIHSIQNASARNDQSQNRIENYIQAQNNAMTAENKRSQLLESLRAPEMRKRYNDLMDSSEANLDGVFASYQRVANNGKELSEGDADHIANSNDKDQGPTHIAQASKEDDESIDRVWFSFLAWLRSNDPLFCIQGKPGSGKSTLMKFLVDDERTKNLLHDNTEPTILSYFFWKIGEPSQNTIIGLLCSLVHQFLVGDDETLDSVLDHDAMGSQRNYNDWFVAALRNLFVFIAEAKKDRLCIFIDGLDEVCNADGIDKLTEFITEFLKHPSVKFCVSSRPEKTVATWLEDHTAPSICLEDLTRPEMTRFATKEFETFLVSGKLSVETHHRLSEEVVEKSQGVFLWLYLAIRSLKAGIRNGDSEKMLLDRLHELPSELEQLYADMWQRLNENHPVYRKTASDYFQFTLHSPYTTNFISETDHCKISQPTLGQIVCASRPELHDLLISGENDVHLTEVQQLCEEAKLDIENRCAGLLQVRPYGFWPACRLNWTEKLNKLFLGHVEFIHRTAHDFLTDTEAGSRIMAHATLSRDDVDEGLFKGLLCICNLLYSKCGMNACMPCVLHQVSRIGARTGSEKSQLTENLLRLLQQLHTNGVIDGGPSWKPKCPFLSCLTDFRSFHDYIVSTLRRSPSVAAATVVLRDSWGHDRFLEFQLEKIPSLELVEALLSMGANPHIESIDNKYWTSNEEPLVSNDTTFTHLLKYGVMGVIHSAYAGGNFATFILKMMLSMAATCPELEAPTLAILKVCENGMVEMTRLEYWTSTPLLYTQRHFYVVLEVKLSFLLSSLISNLKHLVDDNDVISQAEGMLLKLKLSTPNVRYIIHEVQGPLRFIVERVLFQENCHGLVDHLLTRDAWQSEDLRWRNKCPSVFETAWEMTRRLSLEDTSIESMFLSLADGGLGISTFPQAGIMPPDAWLDKMEGNPGYLFPQILKEIKAAKQ